MEHRRLGGSGLKVSEVGIGCNNFGGRCDAAATQAVVDGALAHGITLFDTADVYGNQQSEVLLGAALPVTLLYITRPSIAPDHLWAMRRYLPTVMPAMTIAAAAAASWLAVAIGSRQPRLRAPFVGVAVAALLVGFAGATYDIIIDAYRIELLEPRQLGVGSGMSQYGWRMGAGAAAA